MTIVRQEDHPSRAKWRGIGAKVILIVIVVNAALSLAATATQLYLGYQRDRGIVLSETTLIENSFKASIETALWEFNFPLIEALMDGIAANGDVAQLELNSADGRQWQRQNDGLSVDTVQRIVLEHRRSNAETVRLGEITIGLSLENAVSRVWAQLWTVMASNLAKTMVASALLLALFDRIVTRHLRRVAGHVSGTSWLNLEAPLTLERRGAGRHDEIDLIVRAINTAKARSAADFDALTKQNEKRTAAQNALQEKANALQAANREQAEFTYSISHDLKSPSNTMRMLLDEIEIEEGGSLSPDAREMIQSARQTNARMAQLIDDILAYSRAVEAPFDHEVIDLNALVAEISEDLRADIAEAQATIEVVPLLGVFASRMQVRLLLQNLIVNAIKYAHPDRPPRIWIGTTPERSGAVTISVRDNGIGIDPAHHGRIFGLFKRLHTHDVVPGSGLGLAICERIAANHEGVIEVQSDLENGTTMRVTLPGTGVSGGVGDDDLDATVGVAPLFGQVGGERG